MTEKRFIKVYLDLENQNGCWNCENDWSICKVHHIGTVGFVKGVSHCKLKDWKYKKVEKNHEKIYRLTKENEQLKQENSVFEGKDAKHYQSWVNQIKKYVEETNTDFTYDEDFIIKIALSYTLQSLRNGESLKRFQWDYKELEE